MEGEEGVFLPVRKFKERRLWLDLDQVFFCLHQRSLKPGQALNPVVHHQHLGDRYF